MFDIFLKHKEYVRFIVLSRSRTGSNLLVNSLRTHPQLRVYGEIFRGGVDDEVKAAVRMSAENYLNSNIYKQYDKSIRAVGFKIFYQHPVWDQSGGVWDYLKSMDELRVIHLKRRNILRTLVSRKIAVKTDVWKEADATMQASASGRKVSLSKQECEAFFEKTRAWETQADEMFGMHELLQLSYEDLTSDYLNQMQRVQDFLGVGPIELQPQTRRQNPESLRELIINYDELAGQFTDTKWQDFFSSAVQPAPPTTKP